MAAADYYNPGGANQAAPPQGSQFLHPSQQQQHPQTSQALPYPVSDAPPPYSAYAEPRPHSQPPPMQRPIGPGGPAQFGPQSGPNYPPDKRLHNMYRPSDFLQTPQQQHAQPAYPTAQLQQSGYFQGQPVPPAIAQVYGDGRRPSSTPAYAQQSHHRRESRSRSQSRDRSRSRSRHRKHHHHQQQQQQQQRPVAGGRKKSSGVSTFLGAGGGAIIGDAIFPGLGTLGGAILGGVGGHEYGKQKRSYSNDYRTRPRSYSNDGEYYEDYRRGRKY